MTLNTTLTAQAVCDQVIARDLVSAAAPLNYRSRVALTSGTGAGQADLVFSDTRTVGASSNDDLDLAGGLTDALGNALTFARIKGFIITASAANANNVYVGGDATNTFLTWVVSEPDQVILRPGATLALFAGAADATGYVVTAATGDLLRITNAAGGSSVSYSIVIIGASA
ncbi:MAG: hypothetical protein V4515_14730 [Chloroflexota bacterium]